MTARVIRWSDCFVLFFFKYQHLDSTLFFLYEKGRKGERGKSHFGAWESGRRIEEGAAPQQRWVRSLFLQPTWQHVMVRMLFMSRLLSWEFRLLMLLLRLSRLLCSPMGKPGTNKHSDFSETLPKKKMLFSTHTHTQKMYCTEMQFFRATDWQRLAQLRSPFSLNKETLNGCFAPFVFFTVTFPFSNRQELYSNWVCLCLTDSKREQAAALCNHDMWASPA